MRAFVRLLPKWLKKGNRVRLGDFCLIKLCFSATGRDTKDEVTIGDIKNVRIMLTPGKSLKELVEDVTFEHFEVLDVSESEETSENEVSE